MGLFLAKSRDFRVSRELKKLLTSRLSLLVASSNTSTLAHTFISRED